MGKWEEGLTTMLNIELFKTRLRKAREEKGLTQDEFAKMVNIARANVSYYENANNTVTPKVEVLCNMAHILEVSIDYLIGNTESKVRENIDIAKKLGLPDIAIKEIEDRKSVAKETGIFELDISSALAVMLSNIDFCNSFFPNFHSFLNDSACKEVFKALVEHSIVTEHTDGSDIFLLGMEQALRSLRTKIVEKGRADNGEHHTA